MYLFFHDLYAPPSLVRYPALLICHGSGGQNTRSNNGNRNNLEWTGTSVPKPNHCIFATNFKPVSSFVHFFSCMFLTVSNVHRLGSSHYYHYKQTLPHRTLTIKEMVTLVCPSSYKQPAIQPHNMVNTLDSLQESLGNLNVILLNHTLRIGV